MASPQLDIGHTKISNVIMGALMRTNLSAYQSRILWAIFRKTYGWHKKEDWISNSQLVKMTGIAKSHVSRTVGQLIDRNIVTKSGNKFSLNESYTQWRELPKRVTVTNSGNKVTCTGEHKRILYKRNTYSSETLELTNLLADRILANNPKHRLLSNSNREATIQKWAESVDKLLRIDGQSFEDIKDVIAWCQKDSFWKLNILSGATLRKQWDYLYPKMRADRDKEAWRE